MRFATVLVWLLAAGIIGSPLAAQSKTNVCTLKVTGMTCAGCEAAVKIAAKTVDGVKGVTVSYEKRIAEVTYDRSKTTPDAIATVITEKSGFKAEAPKQKP